MPSGVHCGQGKSTGTVADFYRDLGDCTGSSKHKGADEDRADHEEKTSGMFFDLKLVARRCVAAHCSCRGHSACGFGGPYK